jgi:hypothetical protein
VIINGRLLRGRHFMGPVVATTLGAGGAVVAGTITIFDGAFNAMIPAGATTSAPAVWHRPTPLATGGHGLVSSYSTWNQFAVLRSRRDA